MKMIPALFLVVMLLPLFLVACGGEQQPSAPHVILIVMDTTRGDRCSVNGYQRPTTPGLEALAREGLNFRNTWSSAGWTGPAHASLFTGLLPENHGFRRQNLEFLDDRQTTLAERLLAAGLRTACLTANPMIGPEFGLSQGFENYQPMYDPADPSRYRAAATHQAALDWIRPLHEKGERCFLFINHMEPHFPYTPPQRFRDAFVDPAVSPTEVARVEAIDSEGLFDHNVDLSRIAPGDIEILSDLYDAEIAALDHEIGLFIEELRRAGILDNALVIVTGDHGESLGEHGYLDHVFAIHRPIRYVPLVMRLPGGERAGEVSDEVVRLQDVFPTILEFCGVAVPEGLDARSVFDDLSERRAKATLDAPTRLLYMAYGEKDAGFDLEAMLIDYKAVFDGRLHWIQGSDDRLRVYNILDDPGETSPLPDLDGESPLGRVERRVPDPD